MLSWGADISYCSKFISLIGSISSTLQLVRHGVKDCSGLTQGLILTQKPNYKNYLDCTVCRLWNIHPSISLPASYQSRSTVSFVPIYCTYTLDKPPVHHRTHTDSHPFSLQLTKHVWLCMVGTNIVLDIPTWPGLRSLDCNRHHTNPF